MTAHPEFGKELRRPFEVHENCYDCGDFYDGWKGWRASWDFACRDFNRLPDVMPGTCGQRFPPSRRQAPTKPESTEYQPTKTLLMDSPTGWPGQSGEPGARICGCGVALSKGKRLCDTCRTENRRQTKRHYMRDYMEQRRSAAAESDSGVPFPATATPSTQASGDNLRLTGLR